MKKIRKQGEKVYGFLNGKKVKLTAKKWEAKIAEKLPGGEAKNRVVFN